MDAYLGEIRIFAGNFPPRNWAFCDGQLLAISQYTALFSILGAQYGGNGVTTFALPDFQGHAPVNQGAGLGFTPRVVGEEVGVPAVTLSTAQIPAHTHVTQGIGATGDSSDPTGRYWGESKGVGHPHPVKVPYYNASPDSAMNPSALSGAGGGQPHNNMQPYLPMNFIICMDGIFPPRGN